MKRYYWSICALVVLLGSSVIYADPVITYSNSIRKLEISIDSPSYPADAYLFGEGDDLEFDNGIRSGDFVLDDDAGSASATPVEGSGFTPTYMLIYSNVSAEDLAASESHLTTEFTVSEDCGFDIEWGIGLSLIQGEAACNLRITLVDVTNDETLVSAGASIGEGLIFGWGDSTSLTLLGGHTYSLMCHIDALSVGGGLAESDYAGVYASVSPLP